MTIEQTYQLARGPAAVEFLDYARIATRALTDLLNENPDEPRVQKFLERHPLFVPGAWSPGGGTCSSRLLYMLVSQPSLPGLDGRRPDFMWLAADSKTWFPMLIEIERPSKRIFRRDGVPCADFTQAKNQLDQWRAWFSDPINQLKFQTDYGIPEEWTARKAMSLHMTLIYGRRSEFEHDARLSKQRASLLTGNDEELMSFDRLATHWLLGNALTVRAIGAGRYRALVAPPTMTLGPNIAERLLVLENLELAIDSSEGWSPERRVFVKSRLPYWRDWAKSGQKGWVTVGDQE
jgi:hypothetical protein